MALALKRVLRVRSLLEDVSRADLEKQVMQTARIDEAVRREAESALRLRRESLEGLLKSSGAQALPNRNEAAAERERRFLIEAEREASLRRRQHLERLAERETRRMLACREEFLVKRKERQQVEMLLQEEAWRLRIEEERREQRDLDDWFATAKARLRHTDTRR